jgi:hypothetical protein
MKSLRRYSNFARAMGLIGVGGLLLGSLFVAAACSTGGVSTGKATSQLTPAEQEEQNPEFWRIWEERRGLGG